MDLLKVKFDRKLDDLHSRMQKLVDGMRTLGGPMLSVPDKGWTPEADMYETENEILVLMNLAGVKKEDINVSFHENYLRVEGKRKQAIRPDTVSRYHQLEISHGGFERIFRIPCAIDENEIQAAFEEGLLTIHMKIDKRTGGVYVEINS